MTLPKMTELPGSRVKRAGWSGEELFVQVSKGDGNSGGTIFRFHGVPEKVYKRLCKSGLPDKFLASHIDGKFPVAEA